MAGLENIGGQVFERLLSMSTNVSRTDAVVTKFRLCAGLTSVDISANVSPHLCVSTPDVPCRDDAECALPSLMTLTVMVRV